jgi:hypothetical protein
MEDVKTEKSASGSLRDMDRKNERMKQAVPGNCPASPCLEIQNRTR